MKAVADLEFADKLAALQKCHKRLAEAATWQHPEAPTEVAAQHPEARQRIHVSLAESAHRLQAHAEQRVETKAHISWCTVVTHLQEKQARMCGAQSGASLIEVCKSDLINIIIAHVLVDNPDQHTAAVNSTCQTFHSILHQNPTFACIIRRNTRQRKQKLDKMWSAKDAAEFALFCTCTLYPDTLEHPASEYCPNGASAMAPSLWPNGVCDMKAAGYAWPQKKYHFLVHIFKAMQAWADGQFYTARWQRVCDQLLGTDDHLALLVSDTADVCQALQASDSMHQHWSAVKVLVQHISICGKRVGADGWYSERFKKLLLYIAFSPPVLGLPLIALRADFGGPVPWTVAALPLLGLPLLIFAWQIQVMVYSINHTNAVRSLRAMDYESEVPKMRQGVEIVQSCCVWSFWSLCTMIAVLLLTLRGDGWLTCWSITTACAVNFVPLLGVVLYSILLLIERYAYPGCGGVDQTRCWGQGLFRLNQAMAIKVGTVVVQAVSVMCIAMLVEGVIPPTTAGATLAFLPVWAIAAAMVVVAGVYVFETLKEASAVRSCEPVTPWGGDCQFGCKLVGGAVAFCSGVLWLIVTVHALQCNAAGRPQDQLIVQMGTPFELSYLMIVAVPSLGSGVWCVVLNQR